MADDEYKIQEDKHENDPLGIAVCTALKEAKEKAMADNVISTIDMCIGALFQIKGVVNIYNELAPIVEKDVDNVLKSADAVVKKINKSRRKKE